MKYVGQVIEGHWLIESVERCKNAHYRYVLSNLYNGMKVTISDDVLRKIIKGDTTLGRHMSRLIRKGKSDAFKL